MDVASLFSGRSGALIRHNIKVADFLTTSACSFDSTASRRPDCCRFPAAFSTFSLVRNRLSFSIQLGRHYFGFGWPVFVFFDRIHETNGLWNSTRIPAAMRHGHGRTSSRYPFKVKCVSTRFLATAQKLGKEANRTNAAWPTTRKNGGRPFPAARVRPIESHSTDNGIHYRAINGECSRPAATPSRLEIAEWYNSVTVPNERVDCALKPTSTGRCESTSQITTFLKRGSLNLVDIIFQSDGLVGRPANE